MCENERKGYPIRRFLIKVILAVIFILLLVWLLPMPNVNLKGISDKIFNTNVQTMKDVGKDYFTTDKLPTKVGEKKLLTLQEMLDQKLILPFTDKNGNSCDPKQSYVQLEKREKDYQLKVNLKCGKEENYIVSNVGCYSYCPNAVCEKEIAIVSKDNSETYYPGKGYPGKGIPEPIKKPTTIIETVVNGPACELYIASGQIKENAWFNSDVTIGFKYKNTTNNKAEIKEFGLTESSTPTYNGVNSYVVRREGQTKIYGYVKDTNNKTAICSIVVKKDTVAPTCEVNIIKATQNANGNYVGSVTVGLTSSTDETSGVQTYGMNNGNKLTFNKLKEYTVSTAGNYNIYGFVKDYAGHVKQCNVVFSIKETNTPVDPDPITSSPSCSLKITQGTKGDNNWYVSQVRVEFASKTSTNGARIVSYGLGTSDAVNYNSWNFVNAQKDGYYVVRGYVKDSNGYQAICSIRFKKDATKPVCGLGVQSGTFNSNGYYTSNVNVGFNNRSDNLSGVAKFGIGTTLNYNGGTSYYITQDGTHTVNGYIKDNAGNYNICSINIIKKKLSYEYQYHKHINETYSNWTDWTTKEYDPASPPKFEKTLTKEVEDLGYVQTTKYVEKQTTPIIKNDLVEFATIYETTCADYDYYRAKDTVTQTVQREISRTATTVTTQTIKTTRSYVVKTNTTTTITNPTVTTNNGGGWNYVGLVSMKNAPTETLTNHYEFVGMDWSRCENNCTTTPYTVWKKYIPAGTTTGGGTTTTVGTSEQVVTTTDTRQLTSTGQVGNIISTNTSTRTHVNYGGVNVVCNNVVRKPTKLYIYTGKMVGWNVERTPYVTRVYKYRYRTRNVITKAYEDYRWSYYNDLNLINNGYKMTGNTRIVS